MCEEVDEDLKECSENTPKKVDCKMEELRVADAITEIFTLFKRCNKYIDETMPWALAKDEEQAGPSCNRALQSGREHQHSELLESFLPETSDKVLSCSEMQLKRSMDTFGLYPDGQ